MATAPSSQKAGDRPISFVLMDKNTGVQTIVPLYIRPEDMTMTSPSRNVVHQTLGGAWLDSFGEGVANITISGHTGWHRDSMSYPGGGDSLDGVERMKLLRSTVFDRWHQGRASAVANGVDPGNVRLIFADGLNDLSHEVAPGPFTLKRNKSRPLLAMYQIPLTVIGKSDASISIVTEKSGVLGLDSLVQSINKITAFEKAIRGTLGAWLGPIQQSLSALSALTGAVLQAVRAAITAGAEISAPLLEVAATLTSIGMNIYSTVAAIAGAPAKLMASVMQVSSAFSNAFCLLRNVFRAKGQLLDYSSLYGASNCSSTSGGRPVSPYAFSNPFEAIYSTGKAPVAVSGSAQAAVRAINSSDPVLSPLATPGMIDAIASITAGVSVEAVA